MDKLFYKKRVGSLDQLVYAKRKTLNGGSAEGMKVIDVVNGGGLQLTLLESRCLDISSLSYKGINMGFLSKAGLVSPQYYAAYDNAFTSTFQGGMLYTCGLENIGPEREKDGKLLPIHGSIAKIPAEDANSNVDWEKGAITICGKIKSAKLFGKDIIFERKIEIPLFENEIKISDTVSNEGTLDEEIMLLYHINFGYPMLSENLVVEIDEKDVVPRDDAAASGISRWNVFEAPQDNRPEEVFYHNPNTQKDGKVHVNLKNSEIKTGVEVVYDKSQLPQLVQWKSMASGDYALGIEPATTKVGIENDEKESDRYITLKPGEKKRFEVSVRFFEI